MIFPIYTNHSDARSLDDLTQDDLTQDDLTQSSLSLSQMAIINSPVIIKLFLLLAFRHNVKAILEENTYRAEVIPTLMVRFLATILDKVPINLAHGLEKKSTIISDIAPLNLLPSLTKICTTLYNRGIRKNFRFNPMSHYRILSHFGLLKPVEDFFNNFLPNHDENIKPTKSEYNPISQELTCRMADEARELFKIITVVPVNYWMFKNGEKCFNAKSSTKHPVSEEVIVAITCLSFFKLLIDIAEKIINSLILNKKFITDSAITQREFPSPIVIKTDSQNLTNAPSRYIN
jgi:hypothetical protein